MVSASALGDLADAVLLPQDLDGLLIEDLEGQPLGLADDLAPVLGVGVVAEVRALVHEPGAVHVDDEPERVGVLLEHVAHAAVAEGAARSASHATAWQDDQWP